MRHRAPVVAVATLFSGAIACQPTSITEARDQLGRGGERTIAFSIPVASDTLTLADFLDDTTTTPSGLIGIPVDSQNVAIDVGGELRFDDLTFDEFTFSYDQMLVTEEISTSVTAPAPSAAPGNGFGTANAAPIATVDFDTPNGSRVRSATVASGWIVRSMTNNTSCDASVGITLTDSLAATIATFPTLPVTAGATVVDSIDASGVSVNGAADVTVSTSDFGLCVPNPGESVASDITFRPLTLASVQLGNVNEPFSDSFDALASESRIQSVDTVLVRGGSLTLTAENRLPVQLSFDVELEGMFRNGVNKTGTLILPAAPGDGTTTTGTLVFSLAGDTVVPGIVVAVVSGAATAAQASITPTVTTDAVVVNGLGQLEVESLRGSLDPAMTPELLVNVDDFVLVDAGDVGFDDFEDAIRASTINRAPALLVVENAAAVARCAQGITPCSTPLIFDNLILGAALIDPATNAPERDVNGQVILIEDGAGNPISVPVVDPGMTTLTLGTTGVDSVALQLAVVVDTLVKLLIDDESVALVALGTAMVGDGSPSRIDAADALSVAVRMTVALDLTLPPEGATFTVNDVESGGELDDTDADEFAERIITAGITSSVVNGTPFALQIEAAYVGGDLGADVDVFQLPDRVVIDQVTVEAGLVDGTGRVTSPTTSEVTLSITGAESRALMGDDITTSIRVTLLPSAGSGGRGAVRMTDHIIVRVLADIEVRGGTQ